MPYDAANINIDKDNDDEFDFEWSTGNLNDACQTGQANQSDNRNKIVWHLLNIKRCNKYNWKGLNTNLTIIMDIY